ncbi:MAG: hypothetical protein O3C43_07070 [Verrucomicrobia bacterium]|nr:hypothetical protein [Verrucomicrobiota bacterium]
MKSPLYPTLAATLLACLILTTDLQAANRVVLKAQASEDFVKARALDPTKKIQTYQFMKGNVHVGLTSDPSMKGIPFESILNDLAINLQKEGFYMHKDKSKGDLLIVVHYGVTDVEISYEEFMGYNTEEDFGLTDEVFSAGAGGAAIDFATIDAINSASFNLGSSATGATSNRQGEFYKAQLLGMERAYSDKITQGEEHDLKSMLAEERYFIVLMAYDYTKFKNAEAELLWSTRYSIRTLGQSFGEAIQELNYIASDYFGKNIEGLTKQRVTDESRVKMGEIEVLKDQKIENTDPK